MLFFFVELDFFGYPYIILLLLALNYNGITHSRTFVLILTSLVPVHWFHCFPSDEQHDEECYQNNAGHYGN